MGSGRSKFEVFFFFGWLVFFFGFGLCGWGLVAFLFIYFVSCFFLFWDVLFYYFFPLFFGVAVGVCVCFGLVVSAVSLWVSLGFFWSVLSCVPVCPGGSFESGCWYLVS